MQHKAMVLGVCMSGCYHSAHDLSLEDQLHKFSDHDIGQLGNLLCITVRDIVLMLCSSWIGSKCGNARPWPSPAISIADSV